MSRYTLQEVDLSITIGMDYACQWWVRDHREDPLPLAFPCRMTVRDRTGSILFSTKSPDEGGDIDMAVSPVLIPSDINGMLQLTIPRSVTAVWRLGNYYYDIWATVMDAAAITLFPYGQQMPIAKGRFIVGNRITNMEGG